MPLGHSQIPGSNATPIRRSILPDLVSGSRIRVGSMRHTRQPARAQTHTEGKSSHQVRTHDTSVLRVTKGEREPRNARPRPRPRKGGPFSAQATSHNTITGCQLRQAVPCLSSTPVSQSECDQPTHPRPPAPTLGAAGEFQISENPLREVRGIHYGSVGCRCGRSRYASRWTKCVRSLMKGSLSCLAP